MRLRAAKESWSQASGFVISGPTGLNKYFFVIPVSKSAYKMSEKVM